MQKKTDQLILEFGGAHICQIQKPYTPRGGDGGRYIGAVDGLQELDC